MRNSRYTRNATYNWKYRDSRYDPNSKTVTRGASGTTGKV